MIQLLTDFFSIFLSLQVSYLRCDANYDELLPVKSLFEVVDGDADNVNGKEM